MSSEIALRFWVSLARSGAPMKAQPTAEASENTTKPSRMGVINLSDQENSSYATTNRTTTGTEGLAEWAGSASRSTGCDMPGHQVLPDGFGPSAQADERFTAAISARAVAPSNGVCI